MNKKCVKEDAKIEKVLLVSIILVLSFLGRARDSIITMQRTEAKIGQQVFLNCHMTSHKLLMDL